MGQGKGCCTHVRGEGCCDNGNYSLFYPGNIIAVLNNGDGLNRLPPPPDQTLLATTSSADGGNGGNLCPAPTITEKALCTSSKHYLQNGSSKLPGAAIGAIATLSVMLGAALLALFFVWKIHRRSKKQPKAHYQDKMPPEPEPHFTGTVEHDGHEIRAGLTRHELGTSTTWSRYIT